MVTAPTALDGGVEASGLLLVEDGPDDLHALASVGPEQLAGLGAMSAEALAKLRDLLVIELELALKEMKPAADSS